MKFALKKNKSFKKCTYSASDDVSNDGGEISIGLMSSAADGNDKLNLFFDIIFGVDSKIGGELYSGFGEFIGTDGAIEGNVKFNLFFAIGFGRGWYVLGGIFGELTGVDDGNVKLNLFFGTFGPFLLAEPYISIDGLSKISIADRFNGFGGMSIGLGPVFLGIMIGRVSCDRGGISNGFGEFIEVDDGNVKLNLFFDALEILALPAP